MVLCMMIENVRVQDDGIKLTPSSKGCTLPFLLYGNYS